MFDMGYLKKEINGVIFKFEDKKNNFKFECFKKYNSNFKK